MSENTPYNELSIKDQILRDLHKAFEATKEFSTFKHLWSEDDAEKTLAELNNTVKRLHFNLKLATIKEIAHPSDSAVKPSLYGNQMFVKIRPVADEYKGKTFFGFLIGEVALSSQVKITDEKIECTWAHYNPAIFVPDLNKVIYGCESWWGFIKSQSELTEITDFDIENVWYVKLLKNLPELPPPAPSEVN